MTSVIAAPSQASPALAPNTAGETLLSQGKPATANSYYCSEGCDLPQNGNDGRGYTSWSPDINDTNNPWWQVDLGSNTTITKVTGSWRNDDYFDDNNITIRISYDYTVAVSQDGAAFTSVSAGTTEAAPDEGFGPYPSNAVLPTPVQARYVRVTITGQNDNGVARPLSNFGVREFQVYGNGDATSPVQVNITDANGNPVSALSTNADGWPTPNPLTVTVTVTNTTSAAFDPLNLAITFGSVDNQARFYVLSEPCATGSIETGTSPNAYLKYAASCALFNIQPGESRTVVWEVWVQPSQVATFQATVQATDDRDSVPFGEGQAQIQIPQEQVRPVIFVPGITGSQLIDRSGTQDEELWLGRRWKTDYTRLSLYPSRFSGGAFPTIVATDALRKGNVAVAAYDIYGSFLERLQEAGYIEYQVGGNPRKRTTSGCDLTQQANNPKLFVFAYDWRQDNAVTSQALKDYVGCIRRLYPGTQVDIVAHSMGGLLSRRYIEKAHTPPMPRANRNELYDFLPRSTPAT